MLRPLAGGQKDAKVGFMERLDQHRMYGLPKGDSGLQSSCTQVLKAAGRY